MLFVNYNFFFTQLIVNLQTFPESFTNHQHKQNVCKNLF